MNAILPIYHDRIADLFPGIDMAEYNDLWCNRNKSLLKNALMTPMLDLINDFVPSTILSHMSSPTPLIPKVVINYHPYSLLAEEINLLLKAFSIKTAGIVDIEFINMDWDQLTPMWVKSHYSILVMYEGISWMEYQCKVNNFDKVICPEVTLIAPYLCAYQEIPFGVIRELAEIGVGPIGSVESLASPLINLKLFPTKEFSFMLAYRPTPPSSS